MSLSIRKLVVLGLVAAVFLLANMWVVVNWLQDQGVIGMARDIRSDYLTGTAITIILVLLVLLVGPGTVRRSVVRRCSVCDHVLISSGPYCSACGSKA